MRKRSGKQETLLVFYSDDFKGHCPVGTAAVVVARSALQARRLLEQQHPLAKSQPYTMHRLSLAVEHALVLCDGEY